MRIYLILATFVILFFTGCGGCSRSAQRARLNSSADIPDGDRHSIDGKKNIVKIEKMNGVYMIPVDIDEIPMHFIFDTGAGMISISETEAVFLYKQGKLTSEDITGAANFMDANGNVTEGTLKNLKTVKIGNRVLENVQASVVHNLKAPLLFGQSALEKFGKVSIDYTKQEITFE